MNEDHDAYLPMIPTAIARKSTAQFTKNEEADMWQFAVDNHQRFRRRYELWEQFQKKWPSEKTVGALYYKFNFEMVPNLDAADLDVHTKLRLFEELRIKVPAHYCKVLENYAYLTYDKDGCIVECTLKEDMTSSSPPRPLTPEFEVSVPVANGVEVLTPSGPQDGKNETAWPGTPFPMDAFFGSLKEVIRDTFKETNTELVRSLAAEIGASGKTTRSSSDGEDANTYAFLTAMKTLVSAQNSIEMEIRMENAMKKFHENRISHEELQLALYVTLKIIPFLQHLPVMRTVRVRGLKREEREMMKKIEGYCDDPEKDPFLRDLFSNMVAISKSTGRFPVIRLFNKNRLEKIDEETQDKKQLRMDEEVNKWLMEEAMKAIESAKMCVAKELEKVAEPKEQKEAKPLVDDPLNPWAKVFENDLFTEAYCLPLLCAGRQVR
ncbi:unnamed protein product [Caenorhabditis sp. 36 PRJEB53466]|nr:unnamed protein product [Caenorhabditis sp. 36 PRJEB53466]